MRNGILKIIILKNEEKASKFNDFGSFKIELFELSYFVSWCAEIFLIDSTF